MIRFAARFSLLPSKAREAAMDREHFYATMNGEGTLDYELYLNSKALLSCQKDFKDFCT